MSYQQPYAPTPQPQPAKGRFGLAALAVTGVVGLVVGGVVGGATGAVTSAPEPAPTVTVTATAPAPKPAAAPTSAAPTEEPEPATYKPHKSDWALKLKVRDKQCFGSAGCNVTLKLDPQYVGPDSDTLPSEGTIEVFYKISGDESGPVSGSFTVEDKSISYSDQVDISTSGSGVKPKAKIVDVSYSNG